MARTTTYETQIRIGAKYTGGPEVAKANRDIDRTERNVKGLASAMQRARRHFFDFGKVAAGAFAGFTAAGILGAAVRGVKDLGVAAFKAADEVVKLREGNKRLLMTYGMTSKQAAETEKRLYGVATAMEKGVGHDAEIMSKVLVGMRKSLSTEEIEKNQAAISGYFTAISAGEPTIEKGAQAFEELNNLFMRGKGPALNLMKWDKERIKIFQKLSTDQRKYYGLIRLNQLYGHQTAEFFKTDTGKMSYAMTLFGNLLEDVGEEAVGQKGKIADLLISIATQLDPIAKDLGKIVGYELKKWLEDVNKGMPETIAHWKKWQEQLGMVSNVLDGIAWWLNKINSLSNSVPVIFDLPKWIKDHWGATEPWKPGTIVTPQIPGAMGWRYGGSTGAPTTKEEADRQHEEARKEAERKRPGSYPPYERESRELQKIKRAEGVGDISPSLIETVKKLEGFEKQAKWDYKQWSVGYGTVGRQGQTITPEEAEKALAAELSMHQKNVDQAAAAVGLKLTPGQRDALTSFDFNTGRAADLITSSGGNIADIQRRIPLYNKAGGQVHQGLINRRAKEMAMFNAAPPPTPVPVPVPVPVPNYNAFATDEEEKAHGGKGPNYDKSWSGGYAPYQRGYTPTSASMKNQRRDINGGGRIGGAGGGTSVAMNSPITINGVPAGREGAVGREVTRALQDPDRLVLAQLRSAKGSEQRLTYDV